MATFRDGVDGLGLLGVHISVHALGQRFGKSKYGVQWRAQFMAHGRQEIILGAHHAGQFGVGQ